MHRWLPLAFLGPFYAGWAEWTADTGTERVVKPLAALVVMAVSVQFCRLVLGRFERRGDPVPNDLNLLPVLFVGPLIAVTFDGPVLRRAVAVALTMAVFVLVYGVGRIAADLVLLHRGERP